MDGLDGARGRRRCALVLGVGALALAAGCGGDEGGQGTRETDATSAGEIDVEVEIEAGSEVDVDDDAEPEATAETSAEVSDGTSGETTDGTALETSDTASDADEVDSGPTSSGYPANGLVVRILEPGSGGSAEVIGANAVLTGVLFGDADQVTWQAGGRSGAIAAAAFWRSGTIALEPGDNRIVVTASNEDESVTDSVVVTYNPSFRFDEGLEIRPRVLWVGEESEVVFAMKASRFATADRDTMRLLRVDAQGALLSDEGQMFDDGRVSTSGDEIEQDGVFTLTRSYGCLAAGPMYFRVSVKVGETQSYTAVSSTVRLECLERVTAASCEAHRSLIDAAGTALDGGAELASVQAQLAADPSVRQVGRAEDGGAAIWVLFEDGLLGAVAGLEAGVRGGGGGGGGASVGPAVAKVAGAASASAATVLLESKRALVLSPKAASFGESDEGAAVAEALGALQCPRYEVAEGRALTDSEAGIDRFRGASSFGIVSIASEGEVLFGGLEPAQVPERWKHRGPQEVVWTGSPVSCEGLLQTEIECQVTSTSPGGGCPVGTRCVVTKGLASDSVTTGRGICLDETQVDLRLGNAVITNRGYAVTPSFFESWRGRSGYPHTYVNLAGCRTMYNGSLAASLYASGASAVTGFSGVVDSAWAKERVLEVFEGLGAGVGDGTLGTLFAQAEAEDPSHPGTFFRIFGASNLDLTAAGLINGDFETGSLVGWRASGDGRAVSQFGAVLPVSGKGMGLVSSGLGFSVETGTLEQTFCIPENRAELSLSWKFMSEEFKEWCGNEKFQDRFRAELVDQLGVVVKIVEVTVDDLCSYEDGTCAACAAPKACDDECGAADGCYWSSEDALCEGEFNCQCGKAFVGLTASSLGFDQGGVFEVMWRESKIDVSELAGRGPVTLRLSVEDSGDSQFDTAVLLDEIQVR